MLCACTFSMLAVPSNYIRTHLQLLVFSGKLGIQTQIWQRFNLAVSNNCTDLPFPTKKSERIWFIKMNKKNHFTQLDNFIFFRTKTTSYASPSQLNMEKEPLRMLDFRVRGKDRTQQCRNEQYHTLQVHHKENTITQQWTNRWQTENARELTAQCSCFNLYMI